MAPPGFESVPTAALPTTTSTDTLGLPIPSSPIVQPVSVWELAPGALSTLGSSTVAESVEAVTEGAASHESMPATRSIAKGDSASMGPLCSSRVQSAPSAMGPVASVDAATSAPVRLASSCTNAAPAVPSPTSQP